MKEERALQLISESFEKLKRTSLLKEDVTLNRESVLLGKDSPLDSIGFVTFLTEIEERISDETKKDLYLVLSEIGEFNINKPHLSVDVLAKYIVKLSKGE